MRPICFGKSHLRIAEIDDVLSPAGYQFSFFARHKEAWGTTAGWVRPSATTMCFDRLLLFLYGKSHDRISVDLGVSIVPTGNTWRGLFESQTLTHPTSADGLFNIGTNEDAKTFIRTILPNVSEAHRTASALFAPELTRRTQIAVEASRYCRSQLPPVINDLATHWEKQNRQASMHDNQIAKAFRYWDVINLPFNNEEEEERVVLCYKIAVLTIIANAHNAKLHSFFEGTAIVDDSMDLDWCIQILASQIHSPGLW